MDQLTILFVHGTGVREPRYSSTLDLIRERAAKAIPHADVVGCYWGGSVGASSLRAGGASIPVADTSRAMLISGAGAEEEPGLALWDLLYKDPLIECRLHLPSGGTPALFGPGAATAGALLERLAALDSDHPSAPLPERITNTETIAGLRQAAAWLAAQDVFRDLILRATEPLQYAGMAARAIVARHVTTSGASSGLSLLMIDAELRDATVVTLASYVAGAPRGIFDGAMARTLKALGGLGLWAAFQYGVERRNALMDVSSPVAGDILVYQARGAPFREFIRSSIKAIPGTVVLLAHSLGGVASVDLLVESAQPNVELLITVGSQAPYFYEIGALQTLPHGTPLPSHFPPWLNVYDPRDLLGFVGQKVFGERVTDMLVNNHQSFPGSHGAYWTNATMWREIAARIAAP